jgi:hypothetical protein
MTTRYYFTTAPVDYDYGCTRTEASDEEIRDAIGDAKNLLGTKPWRLVSIDSERIGGTFHEGQTMRYGSGLHPAWDADSEDTRTLGFPSLRDLRVLPPAWGIRHVSERALREGCRLLWGARVIERGFDLPHDRHAWSGPLSRTKQGRKLLGTWIDEEGMPAAKRLSESLRQDEVAEVARRSSKGFDDVMVARVAGGYVYLTAARVRPGVQLAEQAVCPHCGGEGWGPARRSDESIRCDHCNGKGRLPLATDED